MDELSWNDTINPWRHEPATEVSKQVITWIVIDVLIFALTVTGNILTICAIKLSKKISELLANQYIFSLAVSDIMVGLTIPYHLAFTIDDTLGSQKTTCILRFVLIILACSSSMYNLFAIATDRYIAIVLPFHYSRYMRRKVVRCVIFSGWCLSLSMATVPIYWNTYHIDHQRDCTVVTVLPAEYINFIVTPMFVSIWLAMSLLYLRIWREADQHKKRLRNVAHFQLRKPLKESRSVQMVLLILGCFSICWLPYFVTIIYMRSFGNFKSNVIYEVTFTMAVMNSCLNPFIYAWKSANFRKAFGCMFRCKSPRTLSNEPNYITDHVPCEKAKKNHSMVVANIDDGIKTIELHCVKSTQLYIEHDNSDVTTTTCMAGS